MPWRWHWRLLRLMAPTRASSTALQRNGHVLLRVVSQHFHIHHVANLALVQGSIQITRSSAHPGTSTRQPAFDF